VCILCLIVLLHALCLSCSGLVVSTCQMIDQKDLLMKPLGSPADQHEDQQDEECVMFLFAL